MRTNDPGTSVLARAARILGAFSEAEPELDLSRLTEITGLPRSTVHRLAAELVALGQLDRTDDGRYAIGTLLWEIGEHAQVSIRLREVALPHLLALFAATGENVHLAVLGGTEALYVARLTGSASIPTLSRMGGRLPLHATGVGKALLSTMDEPWLAGYFALPRERETIYSVTDEGALREELLTARRLGYATTRQEMTLGNVSFAAPLPAIAGLPRAAVGVVTHLAKGDASRLAPLVMRAATEIGRDLSR
ncbi:MAG: IclR family transcriptional regulator [Microbacteriaceae bacterium]|nr:IclR family transcriptional regulator [Microbacteriaceae bacterium]